MTEAISTIAIGIPFVRQSIMNQVLLIILLALFGLYLLLILYYWVSWKAIPDFKPQASNLKPQTRISVIIPARNEEKNIAACLDSVCGQSYPAHLYEVLVLDDYSTDDTASIVRDYEFRNVTLISLKELTAGMGLNSYKKKAIEIGIGLSSGELIVTTDADCIAEEHWLQTIASFYEQHRPAFIAAPVSIDCRSRFIEIFQALDFMTLQGITGASVHKKIHSMCNGANLAYTRKAFDEVDGFSGIDDIASGDDMLLMHKISCKHPGKVMFLKSTEAIVYTTPARTISEFFSQRIRWASKARRYDDKRIFRVLLLVYLVNLVMLVLPIAALFTNIQYAILNFQFSMMGIWLSLLMAKTVIELVFLFPVAKFFSKRSLLWLFPLMQPFHIIYTVMAGGLGSFGSYTWKERRVK